MSEMAWAAGFFEGEGYIGLIPSRGGRTRRLTAAVSQVDREPLDRFKSIVNTGRVNGPRPRGTPNGQPSFVWSGEGKPIVAVMELLLPFMTQGGSKSAQALKALAALDEWEQRVLCPSGHPLSRRVDGVLYCPECLSDAAKIRHGSTNEECKFGHPRTPENLTYRGECRPCFNRRQRAWRASRRSS